MFSLFRALVGPRKDPTAPGAIHRMALIAFFAWVGLGADGLSSACYGPEEAFLGLGEYTFLAIPLAVMVMFTVAIISASYAQVIELFPAGGGGYIVATRLLGKGPGLVSGSALVVDYVLTIAISIASGIDQILSFLPQDTHQFKMLGILFVLALLTVLNLRGVKESILVLLPIFLLFLVTHALMIFGVLVERGSQIGPILDRLPKEATEGGAPIGIAGMLGILFRAFTHGAGTFTGIEAVSNSMQILREPKVRTGKRTMLYMGSSLAVTAGGILIGYLLVHAESQPGMTLNAVFFEKVAQGWPAGHAIVVLTLIAEGALLFVAAQAGFIGGPRSLATMAHDRWVPSRFAHLSDRLVIADGVMVMAVAAFVFLLATKGDVKLLVVLYSINVFITFVLAQLGMLTHWLRQARAGKRWLQGFTINGLGFVICLSILVMMIVYKFTEGGWITLVVTSGFIVLCMFIRAHYARIEKLLRILDQRIVGAPPPASETNRAKDLNAPTAVLLVSGFNGLGLHALLTLHRLYPGHYRNFVFISVGQVDYDRFQSEGEVRELQERTRRSLERYRPFVDALGGYYESRVGVAADVVGELERTCLQVSREFPRSVFFGGQLVFERETPWMRLLHSYITYDLQRRLHLAGMPITILPVRMREGA